VETAMAQRNFSRKQRISYGAYVILTEFTNGNGRTATDGGKWKPLLTCSSGWRDVRQKN